MDYRVRKRPLNPLANEYEDKSMTQNNKQEENNINTSNTNNASGDWIEKGRVFRHKRRNSEPMCMPKINPYDILSEFIDEEDVDVESTIRSMCMKRKIQGLNEEVQEIQEKYDIESVTVETMECLIHDLNDDHVKSQAHTQRTIKSMKFDYSKKMQHNTDLIRSKEKRLKGMRDRLEEMNKENEQLRKVNEAKEVEIISMMEEVAGVETLENENKDLKQKVGQVEEVNRKLNMDLDLSKRNEKDWQDKFKKLDYKFRVNNWLSNGLDDGDKQEIKKRIQQGNCRRR